MRVASNKLSDIIGFYYSELEGIYAHDEITAMAAMAIEHYLGITRRELPQKMSSNVNQSELIKLYDCAKLLKQHRPLQYILGQAWFYGLTLRVNESVLIPRPETEELVDLVLKENKTAASFFDIGTGSGCIPVSINKNRPNALVSACDISAAALAVARQNALLQQVPVHFFEADVLDAPNFLKKTNHCFEVILSNPPYIKPSEKNTLSKNVLGQEPDLALFVEGEDAILFYKKIIDLCGQLLEAGGRLYFELNPLTAASVEAYAQQSELFAQTGLIKDLSGKQRFFKGIKK